MMSCRICAKACSDVHGPARLKCPGPGSALPGSGFRNHQAGPLERAQAWLGLGSGSGHGFTKAGVYEEGTKIIFYYIINDTVLLYMTSL